MEPETEREELIRLRTACAIAAEIIKDLCCYSTGCSVLAEEPIDKMVTEFVRLFPEGADSF